MKKILLVICMLLCITGCGKVAKLENGQDAVVKLKNGDISVDSLYNEMKEKYAVSILMDMMDRQILEEKYKTDDEETSKINSQIESMRSQFDSEESYLSAIQQYFGVQDNDELKSMLSLNYKRNLAVLDYAKGLIKNDEIEKYYNDEVVGDMKLSHILIKPDVDSNMSDDEKQIAEDAARKEAQELISRLNNGEDFATLAKEYSDDTGSATDGGNVGTVNKQTNFVKEFIDASIPLEVNTYTKEPVKSQHGYHIILKTEQKEKPSLDSVKDEIIDTLANEKLSNQASLQYEAIGELRKEYGMDIQDDTLKSLYNKMMNNLINQANSNNQ